MIVQVIGGLKDLVFAANLVWPEGKKEIKVIVKLDDLSMFTFGESNISEWLDRGGLGGTYEVNGDEVTFEEAKRYGVDEFCLRLLVVPSSHTGASVNVGAHPSTKDRLKQRLAENYNTGQTPHISLQVQEASPNGIKSGRAAHALFTRQELPNDGYGVGVLAWLDCTAEGEEDVILPEGDEVKEATIMMMRKSTVAALSTTVASLEVRMRSLVEGKAGPLRNPPHVFPEFTTSDNAAAIVQG